MNLDQTTCSCPCGKASFKVTTLPFARFYCHCEVCQKLYKRAFADVTVLRWKDIDVIDENAIEYKKYRPFPAIDRGTCRACGAPILASMGFGPLRLALTAGQNYADSDRLPESEMHIFYHRKQTAVDDGLKKVCGYVRSELAATGLIMKRLFHPASVAAD